MRSAGLNRLIIPLFALFWIVGAKLVAAEPVTTIRPNGDPANRVDIAIVGDGYGAGQLALYTADVENFINGLFAQEPFREYQRYFNVHRVDVVSPQSGADHPERQPPLFRDTAFDATYNCFGIARLICVDTGKVFDVLQRTLAPDERDVVVVIVNDPEYGGSGGAVAVASTNIQVVELVLHELGHSLGLLADEYDTDPQLCDNSVEPAEPNVTQQMSRGTIKWNFGGGPPTGWIELATEIPTPGASPGVVGLYEGARYCTSALFRPTFDSRMRSLNRPFEQVNTEQLVRRIYNWVSPVDASEPLVSNVSLPVNGIQEFRVQTPALATGKLKTTWKVDGQEISAASQFTLSAAALSPGVHSVALAVEDPTSWVRHDPANVLVDGRTWNVDIDVSPLRPDTSITASPPLLSKSATSVFFFSATASRSKFSCSLDGAPFSPCRSPKRYSKLLNGLHTFQVMASDPQGLSDLSPASYAWTIDTARPETAISSSPMPLTNQSSALFEFTSSEGTTTFQCKLDATAYLPCTNPRAYSDLVPGRHTFQVAAIDGAGNVDKKPAVHRWLIDATAPETAIRSKPVAVTSNKSATFSFSANERGSTFECSLNGNPFAPCVSPQTYALAVGSHIFRVRATDPAGNLDPTPASYAWTIE
jgi:hypothetical protein